MASTITGAAPMAVTSERSQAVVAGLAGGQIDRRQAPAQGRDRLEVGADDEIGAVGDAALEPARAVGRPLEAALGRARSRRGPAEPRTPATSIPAPSDAALTEWIETRACDEPAVELAVPVDVGAEPGRQAAHHGADHAAHGVAVARGRADRLDQRAPRRRVAASPAASRGRTPAEAVPVGGPSCTTWGPTRSTRRAIADAVAARAAGRTPRRPRPGPRSRAPRRARARCACRRAGRWRGRRRGRRGPGAGG